MEIAFIIVLGIILSIQEIMIHNFRNDRKKYKQRFEELNEQYNELKDIIDEADNEQIISWTIKDNNLSGTINKNNQN